MNEDYLWDKTGDVDPDIEQLENALGRLRYRRPAEPLPLPAMPPRRSFRLSFSAPVLAAAATLLIFLLAGGLWLGLQRRQSATEGKDTLAGGIAVEEKRPEHGVSGPRPPLGPDYPGNPGLADGGKKPNAVSPNPIVSRNKLPRRLPHARQETAQYRERQLSPRREQLAREGEAAKAQLIMALHIASDKLSTVQKKIQVNPGT